MTALYNAEERTLRLAGGTMTCACFGRGERPMVLLPGLSLRPLAGSGLALAHGFRLFDRDFRVYALDRRSDLPEGTTLEDLAEHTAEAMALLGVPRAAVLGVSQGGMIAQYLALNHPERVERLVLAVTASRLNDTLRGVVGQWIAWAEAGDLDSFARDMPERLYSPAYARRWGWMFPAVMKLAKLDDTAHFLTLAKSILTLDCYDRLEEIACPALVLGGREDRVVTGRASEEIAEKLGCEIHMYEQLGHAAYEEAKDFKRRVADFLLRENAAR